VSLERLELAQLAGSKALIEALDEGLEIPYAFRAIGMDDEECFDGAASSLLREIPHEDHDLAVGIERVIHRERLNLESNGVLQASGFREWTDRQPSENVVGLLDEFLRPLHDGRDNVSMRFGRNERHGYAARCRRARVGFRDATRCRGRSLRLRLSASMRSVTRAGAGSSVGLGSLPLILASITRRNASE
jgi:hypothetical protein